MSAIGRRAAKKRAIPSSNWNERVPMVICVCRWESTAAMAQGYDNAAGNRDFCSQSPFRSCTRRPIVYSATPWPIDIDHCFAGDISHWRRPSRHPQWCDPGRHRWAREYGCLCSVIAGYVESVPVEDSDTVKQGQLVATVRDAARPLKTRLTAVSCGSVTTSAFAAPMPACVHSPARRRRRRLYCSRTPRRVSSAEARYQAPHAGPPH
jgi:hypothetical protein